MEPMSHGETVSHLNPTSPRDGGGFDSSPGECVVRVGGSNQSGECVSAGGRGAACGRAGLNAVNDEEMVLPLDRVHVKSSQDACCIESCF
jgi:hypothetical protein